MNNDALKTLVAQGLAAMKTGANIAAEATSEIQNDVKHPDLRAALEVGNQVSEHWRSRIAQALGAVGGGGDQKNPVLEAHYEVSRIIRREAPDDDSRDLGIIADGQLALHYWIAAFGTIGAYAGKLGLGEVEGAMRSSLEEAKQADDKHTEIAKRILGA